MKEKRLTLLNTSVLTSYGTFSYRRVSLDEARALVGEFQRKGKQIQSAIGHQSTAALMTMLLEFPVEVDRSRFEQSCEDAALIFKLKQRVTEGKILSREEIEAIGYEFGLLVRID